MTPTRRTMLVAAGAALAAPAIARAAGGWARDVGVYVEPTLAPAMGAVGRAFTRVQGVGVAVGAASAPLLLAQFARTGLADLLIVPGPWMDRALAQGGFDPATRREAWRNPLVLAARAPAPESRDLAALLAAGPLALTDPTEASTLDGRASLAAAGLAAPRVIGTATTADAAFLVVSGAAHTALVFRTDAGPRSGLAVVAPLPLVPPVTYAMAMSAAPPSRNARAFADFLSGKRARDLLTSHGLEPAA
jgi:ABC-type molybdate transport system substrate-binding protein